MRELSRVAHEVRAGQVINADGIQSQQWRTFAGWAYCRDVLQVPWASYLGSVTYMIGSVLFNIGNIPCSMPVSLVAYLTG